MTESEFHDWLAATKPGDFVTLVVKKNDVRNVCALSIPINDVNGNALMYAADILLERYGVT